MTRTLLVSMVVLATACGVSEGTLNDATDTTVGSVAGPTFEEFFGKAVFVEPETGVFIADGDTPFFSMKQLREFYELNVREGQLIVNRIGSSDDKWSNTQKLNLSYCVSDTFGSRKATMVSTMAAATGAWEAVANVKFVYVPAQDANCTASNNNVLFDVRPVNVNGQYLARSFFPSTSRSTRNVLVDNSAFTGSGVSLVGVLRHELGHTLGFRHEHTRPEAGACFEDNSWRALTPYDSSSVMHYPQCNGTGSFTDLSLTSLDAQGAAALYGAPTGGTGGGSGGGSGGGTGGGSGGGTGGGSGGGGGTAGSTVENFSGSLARGASKAFGPFSVQAGTTFRATLSGTGDADLYVRFGQAPTGSSYDCRPYLDGSAEECTLTVPSGTTAAYITVNGYAAATYSLRVEYTKGSAAPPPPSGGTPQTANTSGSVSRGQMIQFNPISVVPGTNVTVTMTGSGDPDLYVRFAGAPTLTLFDCRPYKNGANESCSLTVPGTYDTVYLMVNGYSSGTYNLTVNYTAP